jgi:NAD-dependent dihydropyrimidine dehydrogenase PreA subunit
MIESIDKQLCIGCGNCDAACPMDVIYLDMQTVKAQIRYKDDCMTCFNCELQCPTKAVHVDPIKAEKIQPW